MIVGHGKSHELLQRHAILGIDVEEFLRNRRESPPLFHDGGCRPQARRDGFVAQALRVQVLDRAEFVERMQIEAERVLGERVLLGRNRIVGTLHVARHGCRLRQSLLFHQQFEGAIAPATGRNFVHAGLDACGVEHWPDIKIVKQIAMGDVFGQLFDRKAGFHAPDVGLRENKLVEGNILGPAQNELGL